jgi:oxygen tolerance protein BatD
VVSRAFALAALLALALAGAARAGDEPISVRVSFDRDSVRVHEQVLLSVVVTHPVDAHASWEAPPFDGFWAERLGMRALPDAPDGLHRTEFRRALFPTRAGVLEIAPSKLVIAAVESGRERDLPVPGAALRVEPLPEGVPPDVLVGLLEVQLALSSDTVVLGRSLSLTLDLSGDANVWDAPVPDLEKLVGPDFELFPEPARTSIGENAGRATTRRTFRYALVPTRLGRLAIPPLEIPYFDSARGALATARSGALAVDVIEGSVNPTPRSSLELPTPFRPAERSVWPFVVVALGALGGAALVALRLRRPVLARLVGTPQESPHAAFDAARSARGTRDFTALLSRAVRVGIGARHRFDARALTSAELAARIDDRDALELLATLDQARFAGRPADEDALLERARAYLRL